MTGDERTDSVHGLLEDAGEGWRSRLSPPQDVEATWFAEPPRARPLLFAGVGAAAVAAVVLLARTAGLLGSRAPSATLAPGGSVAANGPTAKPATASGSTNPVSPTPIDPNRPSPSAGLTDEIVRVGDLVSVSGNVIEQIDGQSVLCVQLIALAVIGSPPVCADTSFVPVHVDVRSLPGAEEDNGTWVSGYLTLEGTWAGDGILVTDVSPAERPVSPTRARAVPCEPPAGGWPVVDTLVLEFEAAGAAVDVEVLAHPEMYAGLWGALVDAGNSGEDVDRAVVNVVATVGDVERVTTELRRIWPYNLCVVQVPLSTSDLERVEASLAADDRPWSLETDLASKGITLRTTVLDEAVAAALGPDIGHYTVESLVRKVADAPEPAAVDEIVREGDLVTMTGNIADFGTGPALCSNFELLSLFRSGYSVSCGVPAIVPVTNIDPRSLDGSDDNIDQVWVTTYLTVTGTWREGAIDVLDATPTERPAEADGASSVPCAPPPEGWSRRVSSDLEMERAWNALDREVSRHPETYTGHWDARQDSTTDPGETNFIAIVGITGEVDAARETLAEIYPYNLCMVQLPLSAADLNRIEQPGAGANGVANSLDLTAEGFVLEITVLDAATAEILGSNRGDIILRPIVRKLADGSGH